MLTLNPFIRDSMVIGDALQLTKKLPDESINMCVTSPPYYGLRDYQVSGQIGLEPTPEEFINYLVDLFTEVKRVLMSDGTLWVVIGDTYASSKRGVGGDIKVKDLIGIPWTLALALRASGWYLRQDDIWHKPNPMPEMVKDRCVRSHEYIFMFSKSSKYYFDYEAIQEPAVKGPQRMQAHPDTVKRRAVGPMARGKEGFNHQYADNKRTWAANGKRRKRSVWTVPPNSKQAGHVAVYPESLIEPMVLAGSPEGGIVFDPFAGTGTTGVVARNRRRHYLLFELDSSCVGLARDKLPKTLLSPPVTIIQDSV